MDEVTQLISFFVSFCFGFFFYFCTVFHFIVIKKGSILLQYVSTLVFILDGVLLYLFLMYLINQGIVHIYFLILVFIGFFIGSFLQKNVKFTNFWKKYIGKWMLK